MTILPLVGALRSVDGTFSNSLYFRYKVIPLHLQQELNAHRAVGVHWKTLFYTESICSAV
jgi:hypothetical protein